MEDVAVGRGHVEQCEQKPFEERDFIQHYHDIRAEKHIHYGKSDSVMMMMCDVLIF